MRKILLLVFVWSSFISNSQNVNLIWEPDNPTNCKLLRSGKFRFNNVAEKDYYMVTNDSLFIEYLESGKKIVKSKVEWKTDCKYKLTILEDTYGTSIPIGDSILVEIINTQAEKIQLRATHKKDTTLSVYLKVMDNNNNVANTPEILNGKNVYSNPIDGQTYIIQGQFVSYLNGEEVSNYQNNDSLTGLYQVILLNSDQEIKESINLKKLKEIVINSVSIFNKNFINSKGTGKILVQFNLNKGEETKLLYAVNGNIDLDNMTQFEKDMNRFKFPRSKKHKITFQIIFNINN